MWLEIRNPQDAVTYKDAIKHGKELKKQGAQPGNQNASVLNVKNKGVVNTFESDKGDNIQRGSTNKTYLTARLKRDEPELFEFDQHRAGESISS